MPEPAVKRVYEPPAKKDGLRILVDRLWPRGLKKSDAALDRWFKEIAPSDALRRWFGHRPERWPQFRRRYRAELAKNPALTELRALVKRRRATLLYGAKDTEHNQAVTLAEYLHGKK
jgi:uncharacterized protein YeaO (DUF488 family)